MQRFRPGSNESSQLLKFLKNPAAAPTEKVKHGYQPPSPRLSPARPEFTRACGDLQGRRLRQKESLFQKGKDKAEA